MKPEYSVLILTRNEAGNITSLLPQIDQVLRDLGCNYEKIIIDGHSNDNTAEVARTLGARVYTQIGEGSGAAFREGLAQCQGKWILALDADHSHPPAFLRAMLRNHSSTDLLIASRYVPGGDANMEFYRNILSRILSFVFGFCLGIPVKDVSSGYRIYRAEAVKSLHLDGRDFDILIETLIRLVSKGYQVKEIPFVYEPRVFGKSNARLFKFAISYLRTLGKMWQLRNSFDAADYEERAVKSLIPLQRYWQRKRLQLIREFSDRDAKTIDLGSGTSRASRALPNLIAMDVNLAPLRYLNANGVICCQATALKLPLADNSIDQIIFNNVIHELPKDRNPLKELFRVLKPDGKLILGAADYSSGLWNFMESIRNAIIPRSAQPRAKSTYSRAELREALDSVGFKVASESDIWGAERIYRLVKK